MLIPCVFSDIIQNGGLNSLVSMARATSYGSLRILSSDRSLSTKILRVISEGNDRHIQQLCDAKAVLALGEILLRDTTLMRSFLENSLASSNESDLINDLLSNDFLTSSTCGENMLNEVSNVLCGLVNILHSFSSLEGTCSSSAALQNTHFKACLQLITSGGIKSLLWLAFLTQDPGSASELFTCCQDIQVDSWQVLASLCPFLVSPIGLTSGTAKWAPRVLLALVNVMKKQTWLDLFPDIYANVLQGLRCLANCESLKTLIIDEFLPHLMELRRHGNQKVSNAATQVCLSMGFNEIELGTNDVYLLGDKFILARSHLLQAMAREEIRQLLSNIWMPSDGRQREEHSYGTSSLFNYLCQDEDTAELRKNVQQQFISLYGYLSGEGSSQRRITSLDRHQIERARHRSSSYAEAEELNKLNRGKSYPRSNSSIGILSSQQIEDINLCTLSQLSILSHGNENKVRQRILLHCTCSTR